VTGSSDTSIGTHAFLYSNGQMTDLGTLGGNTVTLGRSINEAGQVVGLSGVPRQQGPAFLYSNGQMRELIPIRSQPTTAAGSAVE
jgi:probable HAF family extracellular repeat protein